MATEQHVNDIFSWVVGVPSVGVLVAYGLSIIRRRASADSKVINEDRSYKDMLEAYKNERDDMREERDRVVARMNVIEQERNEAVIRVGKLTAEVEYLSIQVNDLKALVEKLGVSLDLARTEMHNCAVENAKLAAHVSYLEEVVQRSHEVKQGGS